MEIIVSGNVSYAPTQVGQANTNTIVLKIKGDFGQNYHVSIYELIQNDFRIGLLNWHDLIRLSNHIRGCEYIQTYNILRQYGIEYPNFKKASFQEIGLIKALFNILIWLESDLITQDWITMDKHIDDEFILDYTGKIGTQEDIYFLPKATSFVSENEVHFSNLIRLNLLGRLDIFFANDTKIGNYFLPLIKPGVSIDLFRLADPLNGDKTYQFFKTLLKYRDRRINKFINKDGF